MPGTAWGLARAAISGVLTAVRAKQRLFLGVGLAVFTLHVFLPPIVFSIARRPWDFFTFNPWLSRLPEYLASADVPVKKKLEFLPNLVLFWFSADSAHSGVEWAFSVDLRDLARFIAMSALFGAYFALCRVLRDQSAAGWPARTGRYGGIAGGLTSVVGLSTGACKVVGCGAPVFPVIGLVFVGLSSGTISLLSGVARVSTIVVALLMALAVGYLGWQAGRTQAPGGCPANEG